MTPAQQSRYFEGLVHGISDTTGAPWTPMTDSPHHFRIVNPRTGDMVAKEPRMLLPNQHALRVWVLGLLGSYLDDEQDEAEAALGEAEAALDAAMGATG